MWWFFVDGIDVIIVVVEKLNTNLSVLGSDVMSHMAKVNTFIISS
jgi:hypothetical protein